MYQWSPYEYVEMYSKFKAVNTSVELNVGYMYAVPWSIY